MLDPLDCGSSSDAAEETVRMVMPPVVHTEALKATIDYCTLRESCGTGPNNSFDTIRWLTQRAHLGEGFRADEIEQFRRRRLLRALPALPPPP